MRRHVITLSIIFVFLVGLSLMLYPYIARYFNSQSQSRAVSSYHEAVAAMDRVDLDAMREAAEEYNRRLPGRPNRLVPTEDDSAEYRGLLNMSSSGIMGSLEISAIGVNLPIYHGTSEGVLQIGCGHYEGTSLPVGGEGTHTVITGHRGLPSSTLLTNLGDVVVGDLFALHVVGETLWYQVDRIQIIEPYELESLDIEPGMDYCTVGTCTPYGINTQRLLVRGVRIDGPEAAVRQETPIRSEAGRIQITLPLLLILTPATFILLVVQIVRVAKIYRKGKMARGPGSGEL